MNFSIAPPIGVVQYITWNDQFNLAQMVVLFIALIEATVEHIVVCSGNEASCIEINKLARVLLFVLYAVVMIAVFLFGLEKMCEPNPAR